MLHNQITEQKNIYNRTIANTVRRWLYTGYNFGFTHWSLEDAAVILNY